MEKPGHSTLSIQVEWIYKFNDSFHGVECLEKIHQSTGEEALWEDE